VRPDRPTRLAALTRAPQARSSAGHGFDLVSLPKYAYEALAWTTVAAIPGNWADACPGARGARSLWFGRAARVGQRPTRHIGEAHVSRTKHSFLSVATSYT
jgi:hypothetical protein